MKASNAGYLCMIAFILGLLVGANSTAKSWRIDRERAITDTECRARAEGVEAGKATCEINWHMVSVGGQLMRLYSYHNRHMGPIGDRIGEIHMLKSMLTYDELKALWRVSNVNQRHAIVQQAMAQGFSEVQPKGGCRVGHDVFETSDPVKAYDTFLNCYEDGDSCEAASIMDKEWNHICDSYPRWLASKGWRVTIPEY